MLVRHHHTTLAHMQFDAQFWNVFHLHGIQEKHQFLSLSRNKKNNAQSQYVTRLFYNQIYRTFFVESIFSEREI